MDERELEARCEGVKRVKLTPWIEQPPATPKPRKRKYNNSPVTTWEGRFDSKKEYRCWQQLCALQAAGELLGLRRQVRFKLKVGKVLVCVYVADFVATDRQGRQRVWDAKGVRTDLYKLKAKLMLACHGLIVEEL